MSIYGQFCPIAMASEVLSQRWTPLVLRELLCGSSRFNELRRGLPLMSPSLLSKRLKTLERVGVVERRDGEYVLTIAGEELRPIIESMGEWGARYAMSDLKPEHMDASLLMWDIHRSIIEENLPAERVVVHFHLHGSPDKKSRFWLVLGPDGVDLCLRDPGFEVHLVVTAHVRAMVAYWMGHAEIADLVREGALSLEGPHRLVRAFPTWFSRSLFADVATSSA